MKENLAKNMDYLGILEAVLSMGQTLNLDKECSRFIKVLTDMGYSHVNIQLEGCSFSKFAKSSGIALENHDMVKFELDSNTLPDRVQGYIEVYKATEFTEDEKNFIKALVQRFENTVTACFCYQYALKEAELRQKVECSLEEAMCNIEKLSAEKQEISKELDKKIKEYTEEFEGIINHLKQMASRDPMTGLYNRYRVLELGEEAFKEAVDKDMELTVIMLDIDDFKPVNDTYGHLVGDRVIEIIGKRLKNAVKDRDLVGRYGGEEFVVILFCGKEEARKVGERIRKVIADKKFIVEDKELPITVSVGVASRTKDDKELEELIRRADEMLYKAKAEGKNKVVID